MLVDNHGRKINYLRLAVTDRCNLRCNYCMPAEGINFAKREELLTTLELKQVAKVLVEMGIEKIRLTGGEPFVRKDIMDLLAFLSHLEGLKDISITTNATLIGKHLDELKQLGIKNINVSLDAIKKETFEHITRRNSYEIVRENLFRLLNEDFNVRVNFIVLQGQNEQDIIPILNEFKDYPVGIRFLEEMPFNGGTKSFGSIHWDHKKILEYITDYFPNYQKLDSPKTSTSVNYKIDGHQGTFGIIPSFSRTFCGSCNRLRVTAKGDVITCLYGKPKTNLREIIRGNDSFDKIKMEVERVIGERAKTGFEAQKEHENKVFESSMTSIGG
ncbi:GTP 3',8-cyclase MoaA [Croceivirga thetidis]|uniref:GTP 3',8-cyclase n=1 Tax=Croceivirga thetidis TaxID=2721623 RepID=A0ABX1GQU9_9FLAO|nr:GTP 3',8-cyclase MoaA [Croceivirga thetidis]NKI32303.1 GTP 3',8-cyclase MoaA [Croceivirga thetidis]